MKALWGKFNKNGLALNTVWMLMGHGAQIPIRAVYFILIARFLGAQGYGAFVGVTALVGILAPFASMGSGNILIKHISRDVSDFPRYWGRAIVLTIASGLLLSILAPILSIFLLPASIPFPLVISVSIADLIISRLLDVSAQAFQGFQRLDRTSFLMALPNISRLLGLLILVLAKKPTPLDLGYIYLASTALACLIAVTLVVRELGKPVFDKKVFRGEIKEGLYFSVAWSSQNIYNDIDKTMLARLATLQAAGIYAAAYRIVDVSFTPVRSLLMASYARFFQSGATGIRGSLGFAVKLLPYAAGYGLAASLLLYMSAPILPYVFGREFAESVDALRWLSLLPLLKVLHYFPANSLTGAGFQGVRTFCHVATAVLNVVLLLWLIPKYSWTGAAWASLASDGMHMIFMWSSVLWISMRKNAADMVVREK
jgi:O-antigen/teichoic acid export membrane protein